jgi:hypothetical protein
MALVYKVAWYTYPCLRIRSLPSWIDVIKRAYAVNISIGHLPTSAVQRVRSADEKTWLHLKSSRLWVPTTRSTETARRFGVIYRLHLQGLRVNKAAKQQKGVKLSSAWQWRQYVPPKRRNLSEIHGVTTQNALQFKKNQGAPVISSCESFWSSTYPRMKTRFTFFFK